MVATVFWLVVITVFWVFAKVVNSIFWVVSRGSLGCLLGCSGWLLVGR